jgi:hypothetical protein
MGKAIDGAGGQISREIFNASDGVSVSAFAVEEFSESGFEHFKFPLREICDRVLLFDLD